MMLPGNSIRSRPSLRQAETWREDLDCLTATANVRGWRLSNTVRNARPDMHASLHKRMICSNHDKTLHTGRAFAVHMQALGHWWQQRERTYLRAAAHAGCRRARVGADLQV